MTLSQDERVGIFLVAGRSGVHDASRCGGSEWPDSHFGGWENDKIKCVRAINGINGSTIENCLCSACPHRPSRGSDSA